MKDVISKNINKLISTIKGNKQILVFFSIATPLGIAALIYYTRKHRKSLIGPLNLDRINKLHPRVRDKAIAFIAKAKNEGIELRVTETSRSFERQAELFKQGGVTQAAPGQSFHNYGLAMDVVPIENSVPNYNSKDWDEIGKIGKNFGFEWGGDWQGFKDMPHFQMTFGKTWQQLYDLYNKGKLDKNGYLII
jgi:peptidoglycan L-alanyl-D-glutamate endopeptidase CwlK